MQDFQYLGILSYTINAIILCIFMLLCGHFLGGRSYSRSKNIPFESGIQSIGFSRTRFSIKFYLIAMIFVLFDVEGIYLYIWSISIRETGWVGFIQVFIFIFILLISIMYIIRIGSFRWIKRLSKYKSIDIHSLDFNFSQFFNDKHR